MDWSKAKSLIIAALLVTDLVLGGFLLSSFVKNERTEREAAANVKAYIENLGAQLECGLPDDERRLPVLFMSFGEAESGSTPSGVSASGGALYYKGIPIVVENSEEGITPQVDSIGASRGDIRPSAYAAAELAGDLLAEGREDLSGLVIKDVYLVYWLYNSGSDASDTAFPFWCFDTDDTLYYVSAFYE